MPRSPRFIAPYIVFSAPSGAGKTTIVKRLLEKYPELAVSISATTRPRRPGEQDGVDYIFMNEDAFKKAVAAGRFLEYEQVHGNYYGTLKSTVEELRRAGKTVVFDIDVKGALNIRAQYPESFLIFIKPPDLNVLIERLKGRKSETEATLRKRLQRIEFEYTFMDRFDRVIVNDELEHAVAEVEKVICPERES
ncbi:MAG: guanylate kinase [Calditrichaeota bacterium]|nr:MAG: guanylate kinase [Calditrichota bacterium]